jgi:hypothetical protein
MGADRGSDGEQTYQITVQGLLDERWSEWFNGVSMRVANRCGDEPLTTLIAAIADQAALRGILSQIWDLNLTVIAVERIEPAQGKVDRAAGEPGRSFPL